MNSISNISIYLSAIMVYCVLIHNILISTKKIEPKLNFNLQNENMRSETCYCHNKVMVYFCREYHHVHQTMDGCQCLCYAWLPQFTNCRFQRISWQSIFKFHFNKKTRHSLPLAENCSCSMLAMFPHIYFQNSTYFQWFLMTAQILSRRFRSYCILSLLNI